MVEVKIELGNEEIGLIEDRLRAYMHGLAPDMISGGETAKVASATATRSFLSRLLRQLKAHQLRLIELERQEKEEREHQRASARRGRRS
jgi:hypothetical protein